MNDQELIEYLKSVQIGLLGKLYVPVAKPLDISEIMIFNGFGIVNPTDSFNLSWKFVVHDATNAQNLQAFCAGTIVFDNTAPANRIILRNADVLGNLIRNDSLPDRFPVPNYIIYQNIDEAKTRVVIRNYLNNHEKIVAGIQEQLKATQTSASIDKIVDLFLSNSLPYGVPVQAGDLIGVMGEETLGSGLRSLSLSMHHELGQLLFLDPAFYHTHWESFFQDLAGHPLEMQLKKIFAGPIANGVIRFVKNGGATTGDFKDPAAPASLVSIALSVADPYDTIVIMDNATYSEPNEITINKAINITSLSTDDVITGPDTFPTLDGGFSHRVINIHISDVSISNVSIAHGLISRDLSARPPSIGGGVLIGFVDKIYIRNCHVHDNQARAHSPDKISEEDGYGGGIGVYHSDALIYHNRISDNTSLSGLGAGIGIFGYGWPVIQENYIFQNHGRDGGGIGMLTAWPSNLGQVVDPVLSWNETELAMAKKRWHKLIKNEIDSNLAEDDGGGVYMTILARTEFSDNNIHNNRSKKSGGGIRASGGSDFKLKRDYIHHNTANAAHESGSGGGGISIRNCSIDLTDVRIEDNVVEGWAGGGIFFASTSEGGTFIFSFDTTLRSLFGRTKNVVNIKGTSEILRNHCTTDIIFNDHRKGGGIYALRIYEADHGTEIFRGLPTTIIFEDINRILSNVFDPSSIPPLSPNSLQIHVEDMVWRTGVPIDDSNNSAFLTSKSGRMEFQYVSS